MKKILLHNLVVAIVVCIVDVAVDAIFFETKGIANYIVLGVVFYLAIVIYDYIKERIQAKKNRNGSKD